MTDQNPLVSIIIPTFNRANLIRETLDSILAQTYPNWECIVTDDGSDDDTDAVMVSYVAKDSRFRYFHRPDVMVKGANSCRNHGLDKAFGEFIVFFDSDDLMTPDHLMKKMEPLLLGGFDYSIAKTRFFNVNDNALNRYYKFDEFEINPHNYILQNINWLTYDVCVKSQIAKKIRFNPKLRSGQEYNYFSKLVLETVNCVVIDNYLTLRRQHDDSIRGKLKDTYKERYENFFTIWETYKEIEPSLTERTKKAILFKCVKIIYSQKQFFVEDKFRFFKELYTNYGASAIYFFLMTMTMKYSTKAYYFREKLKTVAIK